jgi:hypothetical protein
VDGSHRGGADARRHGPRTVASRNRNDWGLLTFDDDVPSLVEGEGLEHAGPIDARRTGRRVGGVVRSVDAHPAERGDDDRSVE